MNEYLKSFLYGIALGTAVITFFGAVAEVRELWVSLLYFLGAAILSWVTYKVDKRK